MNTTKSGPLFRDRLSARQALAYVGIAALAFFSSCEEKVDISPADTKSVENEAVSDAYFEDTDDMATMVIAADAGTSNGGRSGAGRAVSKDKLDGRFACSSTTVTLTFAEDNTAQNPHGTITVDFGEEGCTDGKGNTRKGRVIVEFRGPRFMAGATITTYLDGYEINGIKLEGTRIVTNATTSTEDIPAFTIVLTGGEITWPDGSTATREVERTRVWTRAPNPLNDSWTISGTASGTNRDGKEYEINITKALVYKRECALNGRIFMAVEGTKELTTDGKKVTIDYGAGECDRLVTITVNGISREVEVKGDI
jgi:hypothetical protein